jgi:hypothetical protein
VDGLLESISTRQINEWMAYFNLEPFGDELLDTHLATITSILANAYRGKSEKVRNPQEFRLWKSFTKPFDADELYSRLEGWALLFGGKKDSP